MNDRQTLNVPKDIVLCRVRVPEARGMLNGDASEMFNIFLRNSRAFSSAGTYVLMRRSKRSLYSQLFDRGIRKNYKLTLSSSVCLTI